MNWWLYGCQGDYLWPKRYPNHESCPNPCLNPRWTHNWTLVQTLPKPLPELLANLLPIPLPKPLQKPFPKLFPNPARFLAWMEISKLQSMKSIKPNHESYLSPCSIPCLNPPQTHGWILPISCPSPAQTVGLLIIKVPKASNHYVLNSYEHLK